MGVGIHGPFVENKYKEGFDWWPLAEMQWFRITPLFQLLAGVRGGRPLVEPRGMPDDAGWSWKEHVSSDCHSASWLTPNELRRVRKAYRRELRKEYLEEPFTPELDALIAFIESYRATSHKKSEVRIGFCFDN
jgi:hypothetical protein